MSMMSDWSGEKDPLRKKVRMVSELRRNRTLSKRTTQIFMFFGVSY